MRNFYLFSIVFFAFVCVTTNSSQAQFFTNPGKYIGSSGKVINTGSIGRALTGGNQEYSTLTPPRVQHGFYGRSNHELSLIHI